MTRKELVISALEHREPPIIPHHINLTEQALQQLIAHTGRSDIFDTLGNCLHYIRYWGWPEKIPGREGYFADEFGVVWNRNGADKDIGIIESPIIEDLENRTYVLPMCNEARLRAEYDELVATKGDRFCMAGFSFCLFERLWTLMGMENALSAMVECPEALEQLLDELCSYLENLVKIALEYDIDGVYFGDDWGQQQGLIMGPIHWRKFLRPKVARLYKLVKDAGKYVFQHSCGDCSEIFPDLLEIGLDCYQTFQPEIYDITEMKRMYGQRVTFWGGISTQQCLPYATANEARQEAVRIMNILRHGGGLIIAPTHSIEFDVPPENILAIAEVFQNQSHYIQTS